jgi:hypothetical protein
MKDFMRALDRLRSDDDSPPVSEHRSNESDS